jgi:hypothetical protein
VPVFAHVRRVLENPRRLRTTPLTESPEKS